MKLERTLQRLKGSSTWPSNPANSTTPEPQPLTCANLLCLRCFVSKDSVTVRSRDPKIVHVSVGRCSKHFTNTTPQLQCSLCTDHLNHQLVSPLLVHLQVSANDAVEEEGAIFGASLNQHFTEGVWIIDHFSWGQVDKRVQASAKGQCTSPHHSFFSCLLPMTQFLAKAPRFFSWSPSSLKPGMVSYGSSSHISRMSSVKCVALLNWPWLDHARAKRSTDDRPAKMHPFPHPTNAPSCTSNGQPCNPFLEANENHLLLS